MKSNIIIIIIGILLFTFGCVPKSTSVLKTKQIRESLSALLTRKNTDAFVIFEEAKTKKYVQFAGSDHEELLLNLPSQTLNPEELERAKKLFSEFGIKFKASPGSDYPG